MVIVWIFLWLLHKLLSLQMRYITPALLRPTSKLWLCHSSALQRGYSASCYVGRNLKLLSLTLMRLLHLPILLILQIILW